MKTGADISHWQSSFNATQYKNSGEDFIILKATEGTSFTDPTFLSRWNAAEAIGLPRIAYHFARPASSATAQADKFVSVIKTAGWGRGCSWALDMESADGQSPSQLVSWSDTFCNRVRAALPSKGLFYSYIPFIKNEMGNPGRIPGSCLAWIARYRTDNPYAAPYTKPTGWPDPPHLWQCGDGVAGCIKNVASIGKCDYNQMTDAAFQTLFGVKEDDMYDAAAEKRLMDFIEDLIDTKMREGVRYIDHGETTSLGAPNNLSVVRDDMAALAAKLDAVASSVASAIPANYDNASTGEKEPDTNG